ncbi:DUF58 domain-containing protein [Microbacterium sp. NPDC089695]|uniref:DUF58 domain-containing protein n=1 Tax=Microbacterium sp. NPDC089695 TaxID=3364198 RepID=UPI00380EDB8E
MTDEVRSELRMPVRWHRGPVVAVGMVASALLAAVGLALSRPDVVAIGLPLALASAWALLRRPRTAEVDLALHARGGAPEDMGPADSFGAAVRGVIDVHAPADLDWVQLAVDQGGRRAGLVDVPPGDAGVRTTTRPRHSGPVELLAVTARAIALDGAWASGVGPRVALEGSVAPARHDLGRLPLAPRLLGLHGAHDGSRPGAGGDFRDIHAFAPGDELRRIDWRATARAARRPGELLVRRTDALSDSSAVVVLDTVDDLGSAVAAWGSGDPERSGVTSLDLGREAALSIAATAISAGDRVAFHSLAGGGAGMRSGSGARHLARLSSAIAATGAGGDGTRYRRSPVVPVGSIVFVLSTFFDGIAAQLASRWRASGHAVVAVDTLPELDSVRLTPEQTVAMRTLLAERAEVLAELQHTGIEVVRWVTDRDVGMRLAARRQQRMRAVRR